MTRLNSGVIPSWQWTLLFRSQFIDLLCKSIDWFLYGRDLPHERIHPFLASNPILYPLKNSKVFWCFPGVKSRNIGQKRVNLFLNSHLMYEKLSLSILRFSVLFFNLVHRILFHQCFLNQEWFVSDEMNCFSNYWWSCCLSAQNSSIPMQWSTSMWIKITKTALRKLFWL